MRPILFDTNAYVSFKRNESSIIEIVQHAEWLAISPIVIGELVAGFNGGNRAKQNKLELQKFLESSRIIIYPLTIDSNSRCSRKNSFFFRKLFPGTPRRISGNCCTIDTSHFFSQVYCSLKHKGKPFLQMICG